VFLRAVGRRDDPVEGRAAMTDKPLDDVSPRKRYRLLTGPDDAAFCDRVSQALSEGYRLHGSPAVTFDGTRVIAAQAVVLDEPVGSRVQQV
jgi:hypothetical protein